MPDNQRSIGRLCGPWSPDEAQAFIDRLREIIIREKVMRDAPAIEKQPQERPKLRPVKEGDER